MRSRLKVSSLEMIANTPETIRCLDILRCNGNEGGGKRFRPAKQSERITRLSSTLREGGGEGGGSKCQN